jgi:hypothetical protein
MLAVLMLIPLGGCITSSDGANTTLPPVVPADIQACFQAGPVKIPLRALTAGEVEALWGDDRIRIVVMKKCGARFLSWYDAIRKGGNDT